MQNTERCQLLALLALAVLFLFPGLDVAALIDWDENIYAEASRQMVLRGDYLNIFINDYPFAEKPPFFFWLQSLSYHLFGIGEFAARFPSAVAGLLLICWLYFVGRRSHSSRLGMLWAVIYLSSTLPGIFARSAVIDHTFNLFISLGTFMLFFYEDSRLMKVQTIGSGSGSSYWGWLCLGSLFMGLAVLTKGPIGGVIPLVAFASFKFVSDNRKVPLHHFLICGILSLIVACSWYMVNWYVYGSKFLEDFIGFQLKLFNQPLEGHTGPFYYHWGMILFGMMPWTVVLFLGPFRPTSHDPRLVRLLQLGLGWTLFVLILFSLVSTKLPHYSASVYIPLSLWAAAMVERRLSNDIPFPFWFFVVLVVSGILLAISFLAFPHIAEQKVHQIAPGFPWDIPDAVYWTGGGMMLLILLGTLAWSFGKVWAGIIMIALGMVCWTQGLWRYQVPLGLTFLQGSMLNMVAEANRKNQPLVLYRYVSFASIYYGGRPVEMLHTYKFPGDPGILDKRGEKTLSVITKKGRSESLLKEHPLVVPVRESGQFILLELPAFEK